MDNAVFVTLQFRKDKPHLLISWQTEVASFVKNKGGFRGDIISIFIRASQQCFHWPKKERKRQASLKHIYMKTFSIDIDTFFALKNNRIYKALP